MFRFTIRDLLWLMVVAVGTTFIASTGCNRHFPSSADPAERRIVSALRPCIETISWNKAGHVDSIMLSGDAVTDKEVAQLGTLKDLWEVNICGPEVTDDCVTHLCNLPRLVALSLAWTQVTDRGVESLASVQSLNTLVLDHTKITDASVEPIGRMKHLERLFVAGTQLTDAGVESLKSKLPKCHIQKQ